MEPKPVTANEAQAALDAVKRQHERVLDEIGLPNWYWWGIALGWLALGVIADLQHPWLTSAATLLFGAVHASIAPRVVNGRHRTNQLSVRRDLVGRHTTTVVLGGLIALALLDAAIAILLDADGAGHPATLASVFIAVVILLGGPRLLARRR